MVWSLYLAARPVPDTMSSLPHLQRHTMSHVKIKNNAVSYGEEFFLEFPSGAIALKVSKYS